MDVFTPLVNFLLTNPAAQGVIVSVVVAKLRDVFSSLDTAAKDPARVKEVQALVAFLSILVTVLSAWAGNKLTGIDPNLITNAVTAIIAAFGAHQIGTDVKAAVAAKK